MNRRTFLKGLSAAVALAVLPIDLIKQEPEFALPSQDVPAGQFLASDGTGFVRWVKWEQHERVDLPDMVLLTNQEDPYMNGVWQLNYSSWHSGLPEFKTEAFA